MGAIAIKVWHLLRTRRLIAHTSQHVRNLIEAWRSLADCAGGKQQLVSDARIAPLYLTPDDVASRSWHQRCKYAAKNADSAWVLQMRLNRFH